MKTGQFSLKKSFVLGSASVFIALAAPVFADAALEGGGVFVRAAHAAGEDAGGAGQGGKGEMAGGQGKGQGTSAGGAGKGSTTSGSGHTTDSGSSSSDTSTSGATSHSAGDTGGGHTDSGQGGKGGTSGGSDQGQRGGSSGGRDVKDAVTSEEDGGKGQMGSGVHGQGAFQDNRQQGGGSAPGPGGINSEPNDAKGPRFSGGVGTGSSGGKPAWAQEGLPTNPDGTEVELGRLNVARAPGKLLDQQLVEATAALADLVADGSSLYQTADLTAALALISQDVVRIDSPLENLALLKDFLTDGVIDGNYVTTDGTTNELLNPTMTDAEFVSLLLGSAADKTVTITEGTVGSMEVLLGVDLGDNATIAETADAVRKAILDAHED